MGVVARWFKFPVSDWLIEKLSLNKALMRVGKNTECLWGDYMPGTEKEEGLRSLFCFVVWLRRSCLFTSEAAGAWVHWQLLLLAWVSFLPFTQETLVLRSCPSGGFSPSHLKISFTFQTSQSPLWEWHTNLCVLPGLEKIFIFNIFVLLPCANTSC